MADYSEQVRDALAQMKLEDEQANSMGPKSKNANLSSSPVERQSIDISPNNTGTVLDRLSLKGSGTKSQGNTVIGGRLGYNQPIDDSSSIEAGVSGHYAKGKDWKDVGIDNIDAAYQKRLESGNSLRASIGAGKSGIDSAKLSYNIPFKKGGTVTASSRADGIALRGKTKGHIK